MKKENLFKKVGVLFLVESRKIENAIFPCKFSDMCCFIIRRVMLTRITKYLFIYLLNCLITEFFEFLYYCIEQKVRINLICFIGGKYLLSG